MLIERKTGRGKPLAHGFMHVQHCRMELDSENRSTNRALLIRVAVGDLEIGITRSELMQMVDSLNRAENTN